MLKIMTKKDECHKWIFPFGYLSYQIAISQAVWSNLAQHCHKLPPTPRPVAAQSTLYMALTHPLEDETKKNIRKHK